jgi:uncharacterized surface protein with fasciclin (FAS1) repeats
MSKLKITTIAVALFIGTNVGFAQANSDKTIVEIAQGDENFSALVEAVVAQDLAATLSGAGPFTVFAPTNDAFTALPGYVALALNANPDLLTDILLYHVVAGSLKAEDVLANRTLTSLNNNQRLMVSARNGAKINQANIVATDVLASNGVVHVIDAVLIPNSVYEEARRQLTIQIRDLYTQLRDMYRDRAAAQSNR